jgi:hypothetical protein
MRIDVERLGRTMRRPRKSRGQALHDPMTQSLLSRREDGARCSPHESARRRWRVIPLAQHLRPRTRGSGWPGAATRSTTCATRYGRTRPRPVRRRTDDVRAGQFRALPAQDLQRQLDHRRRGAGAVAVQDDQAHPRATPEHTLSAYSDNAAVVEGYAAARFRPDPATQRTAPKRRRQRVLHQGRNPQPPDRDRAVPGRSPPVPAARSATKARPAAAASPRPA